MEALGFTHYWGVSPAIDLFEHFTIDKSEGEFNILLIETCDIRHILKTVSDNISKNNNVSVNIYVHEKNKEILARDILLLHIINDKNLGMRDRVELFMDIYGNALIRDKSANYINDNIQELIKLITEDRRCKTPIKDLIVFDDLKFKDRDALEDIFQSWNTKVPFDIEKLRDQRLRHHYGERFDFRSNAIDWDYQMNLKAYTKIISFDQYKAFRQTGVAFETRLSTYIVPNRTLSSYIPGRSKKSGDSVLVRGYWGDIVNSPYFGYGIEVWKEPERTNLNREINFRRPYNAGDISEYNLMNYLHKLETFEEYKHPFEILKKIEQQRQGATIEEVDENEEEKKEEMKEEEVKAETIEKTSGLLEGFKNLNVKIILLSDDIENLFKKKKYENLFHLVAMSIHSEIHPKKEGFKNIIKDNTHIYMETADYVILFKKEQKEEYKKKLVECMVGELNYKEVDTKFSTHHLLFKHS